MGYGEDIVETLAFFMHDEARGHLGAPAHPVHARAHPDAAVGRRAALGARRSRRVPALQGAAARSAA